MVPHSGCNPGVPPIFWISGPPAAGKTTVSGELLRSFSHGFHLPVDDLRTWVVQGIAESVPWTDETERQFQIAEGAVCDIARRYQEGGFAVAVDHCRNPQRLERLISAELPNLPVIKVLLMPELETNLHRSHTRTNKTFDPHWLDDTIRYTNEHYRLDIPDGWLVIDSTRLSIDETVHRILERVQSPSARNAKAAG